MFEFRDFLFVRLQKHGQETIFPGLPILGNMGRYCIVLTIIFSSVLQVSQFWPKEQTYWY